MHCRTLGSVAEVARAIAMMFTGGQSSQSMPAAKCWSSKKQTYRCSMSVRSSRHYCSPGELHTIVGVSKNFLPLAIHVHCFTCVSLSPSSSPRFNHKTITPTRSPEHSPLLSPPGSDANSSSDPSFQIPHSSS